MMAVDEREELTSNVSGCKVQGAGWGDLVRGKSDGEPRGECGGFSGVRGLIVGGPCLRY